MRGRSSVDDARRRGGEEPLAQPLGNDKVGHMVQCESAFETIFGESAAGENCSRVVDQYVNTRFLAGDFGGYALHFGDARQIGVIDRVCEAMRSFVKPRESHPSA